VCGRFSLSGEVDFYADYFGAVPGESLAPSWNVAPTDPVYVVAERDGIRRLETMRWGLIPSFSADPRSLHINARSETAAASPAFRASLARRRCLIPADGFYEWEPRDRGGGPHWIFRADGQPVGFAGLWAGWRPREGGDLVRTCAIITAPASGVVSAFHDRMPMAISHESWEPWLDRQFTDPEAAAGLLSPIDPELWMELPVSKRVNSVRNNGPDLQLPDPQGRFL
jgi:putative SOS response-associated peptidase YedK